MIDTIQKGKWTVMRISKEVREAILAESLGMLDSFDKILRRKYKINIVKGKEPTHVLRKKRNSEAAES